MTDGGAPGGPLDELAGIVRRRRMVRTFEPTPLARPRVAELIDVARRAPSAGNTQALEWLVLDGDDVARYWTRTLGDRRGGFRWQGLLVAPVLVVPYVQPSAYVSRYAEPDKASSGLGEAEEAWSVPYWWIDGGAAVQNLLLAVTAAGLGACFFGQFEHEAAVRAEFGVPDDRRALGTVAVGHPAPDEPGRSAGRRRPSLDDVVHRGRW